MLSESKDEMNFAKSYPFESLLSFIAPAVNNLKGRLHCLPAMISARLGFFIAGLLAVFTILFTVLSVVQPEEITIEIVIVSIILVIGIIMKAEYDFRKALRESYSIEDSDYKEAVLSRLFSFYDNHKELISNKDTIRKYEYLNPRTHSSEIEYYTFNPSQHLTVLSRASELSVNYVKSVYAPPFELREFYPSLTREMVQNSKSHLLFNGRLLRLMIDINEEVEHVSVQEARYFDYVFTNEQVFKQFRFKKSLHPSFEAMDLMARKDGSLRSLSEGVLADILGISTLVLTSDGVLIIARHGFRSMANPGRLAPSGSGSVDLTDLRRCQKKCSPSVSLSDLLIEAAEREFLEESGWKKESDCASCWNSIKGSLSTRIIGYSRLINRGGKPDFFALSYSKKTFREVINLESNIELKKDIMQSCLPVRCKPETLSMIAALKTLESNPEGIQILSEKAEGDSGELRWVSINERYPGISELGMSIQLRIMREILECLLKYDLDPLDTLV